MEDVDESSSSDWESIHDGTLDELSGGGAGRGSVILELPPGCFAATAAKASGEEGDRSAARSSISSFEPVSRFDDTNLTSGGSSGRDRVVLELPPGCFAAAPPTAGTMAAAETSGDDGDRSAVRSSSSSFVPASRFDDMSVSSTVNSFRYESSTGDDLSSLGNFEILSLSSGELVRRCKRCKFHNGHDSVVCASCALALVANPNVEVDAQIALHLQQKEERDAMTVLQEAERKRDRIRSDAYYEHACILAGDVRETPARYILGCHALPKEDLEVQVIEFIKRAVDFPKPKEISLAFKCTPRASLESIRASGLPDDHLLGTMTREVEVSYSLADALASFKALGTMGGEPLRPIPENGIDSMEPNTHCLCWVVAILQAMESPTNRITCPPGQTLPLAYFDSSTEVDGDHLDLLIHNFRRTFLAFFVENFNLPISVAEPPKKKSKHGVNDYDSKQSCEGGSVDASDASSPGESSTTPGNDSDHSRRIPSEDGSVRTFSASSSDDPAPAPKEERIVSEVIFGDATRPDFGGEASLLSKTTETGKLETAHHVRNLRKMKSNEDAKVEIESPVESTKPDETADEVLAAYDGLEAELAKNLRNMNSKQDAKAKLKEEIKLLVESTKPGKTADELRAVYDGREEELARNLRKVKAVQDAMAERRETESLSLNMEEYITAVTTLGGGLSRTTEMSPQETFSLADEETFSLKIKERITAVAALGSGLAVCHDHRDVLLWNKRSGIYGTLKGSGVRVSCFASAPSALQGGHLLATGRWDGDVVVYELLPSPSKETVLRWNFANWRKKPILDLCFLPKGTRLAATNIQRECQLWSLVDGSCICSLKGAHPELRKGQEFRLTAARFSPDGSSLASFTEGSPYVYFWKFNGANVLLAGHESSPDVVGRKEYRIRAISFSHDGKYLASAANDCTIRIWEIQKDFSPCPKLLHAHDALSSWEFSRGSTLISPCSKTIRAHEALSSLAFSPDSALIAGGCANGAVRVWNAGASGDDVLFTFPGNTGSIRTIAFLPDGKTLASIGWCDCILRLWSLERR